MFSNIILIFIIFSYTTKFSDGTSIYTASLENIYKYADDVYNNKLSANSSDVKMAELILSGAVPEIKMNVKELIEYRNYPYEEHKVTTQDGYILTMHRIPNKVNRDKLNVIYLQHGLLCSSADWVMNNKTQSFAFILHDAGYDVWLGNIRGNVYSKSHIKLSSDNLAFWDFSFSEMAQYDLPAMVDYVLEKTGVDQLYYVGHSQGTLVGFSGFSENQNLAQKIKMFFALAPVAFLGNIKSPLGMLAPFSNTMDVLFNMFGHGEFMPNTAIVQWFGSKFCTSNDFSLACINGLFVLVGFNEKNLDPKMVPVYAAHSPAGTSTKNFIHFSQLITADQLRKFDYGTIKNLLTYGSSTPPEYPLKKFNVPTVMFWGEEDWLAGPDDVSRLIPRIQSLKASFKYEKYNHIDFLWGLDAPKLYDKILKYMSSREN